MIYAKFYYLSDAAESLPGFFFAKMQKASHSTGLFRYLTSIHFQPVEISVQDRLANSLDLQQFLNRRECPICFSVCNNRLRFGLTYTRQLSL